MAPPALQSHCRRITSLPALTAVLCSSGGTEAARLQKLCPARSRLTKIRCNCKERQAKALPIHFSASLCIRVPPITAPVCRLLSCCRAEPPVAQPPHSLFLFIPSLLINFGGIKILIHRTFCLKGWRRLGLYAGRAPPWNVTILHDYQRSRAGKIFRNQYKKPSDWAHATCAAVKHAN